MHLEGSPRVPTGFFEWAQENKIPVLGICYGMQVIVLQKRPDETPAHVLAGTARPAKSTARPCRPGQAHAASACPVSPAPEPSLPAFRR